MSTISPFSWKSQAWNFLGFSKITKNITLIIDKSQAFFVNFFPVGWICSFTRLTVGSWDVFVFRRIGSPQLIHFSNAGSRSSPRGSFTLLRRRALPPGAVPPRRDHQFRWEGGLFRAYYRNPRFRAYQISFEFKQRGVPVVLRVNASLLSEEPIRYVDSVVVG